jgi:hypothetical protein
MIKITRALLVLFMLTASLQVVNAAFPKDNVTVATTATTVVTNATMSQTPVTQKEVKKELKSALKNKAGKSKIVAALLAFFLGTFGVHSFYMGNKKKGFIQLGLGLGGLILTIVGLASAVTNASTGSVSIPVLAVIGYIMLLGVGIWALVDFIRILTGGLAPEEGFTD